MACARNTFCRCELVTAPASSHLQICQPANCETTGRLVDKQIMHVDVNSVGGATGSHLRDWPRGATLWGAGDVRSIPPGRHGALASSWLGAQPIRRPSPSSKSSPAARSPQLARVVTPPRIRSTSPPALKRGNLGGRLLPRRILQWAHACRGARLGRGHGGDGELLDVALQLPVRRHLAGGRTPRPHQQLHNA